jgi:hypothetical protein
MMVSLFSIISFVMKKVLTALLHYRQLVVQKEVNMEKKCAACSGSGYYDATKNGKPIFCAACSGSGLAEDKKDRIIWLLENSQNYRGWKREALELLKKGT